MSDATLEILVEFVIHLLPLVGLAFGWHRVRSLRRKGVRLGRVNKLVFWLLTIGYLLLFLAVVSSLQTAALTDKFLFTQLGIRLIYVNLLLGPVSCFSTLFRPNPARRSMLTAAILVALVSFLDLVRAVDVGL